ncbi:MAG: hypothetical protein RLZZ289_270 [Bacteroidota bacterium]
MKKLILPISLLVFGLGALSFNSKQLEGFQAAPTDANGPAGGKLERPANKTAPAVIAEQRKTEALRIS